MKKTRVVQTIILTVALLLSSKIQSAKAFIYAPCCLSASTVSQNEIDIAWVAVSADPAVTGYNVERESPIGGGFTTILANTSATTYNDTNLTPGTTYNYRVYAINATDGVSPASAAVAATTKQAVSPSVPETPTGLKLNLVSASEIDLSWTAPNSASAITGYRIEREAPYGSGFSVLQITTSSATTYADANLSPGVFYNYRVIALNQFGPSLASLPASATTPKLPSDLPSASALAGDGQARISWLPPYVPGGTLTGYVVGILGSTTAISVPGSSASATITGLTNGAHYTFTVAAVNLAGTGPAKITNEITPVAAPVVPVLPPTAISVPSITTTTTVPVSAPSQTPGYLFVGPLSLGSKGQAVSQLQKRLQALGFLLVQPTGYFGGLTRAALQAYQRSRGIQTTGTLGPLTRASLNSNK